MVQRRQSNLVGILWFLAATLALAAGIIRYARHREFEWYLVAVVVFLVGMGFASLRAASRGA